ncbi:hypothetical protein [Gordonia sp. (in: high G+C Gram-positive bacteria)]|jgi:hypothetical protein|nr:hypothetical protein [Gordonia sp. (in: high G+C Gram-positive bacteria)]HQV18109.1 hypothetical protein [Gordonia sp. (in: high G+C Gram-positive bacteria)]
MALPVVSLLPSTIAESGGAMIENGPLACHMKATQPTSAQVAATPPTDFTRSGVVDLVIPVYTFVAGSSWLATLDGELAARYPSVRVIIARPDDEQAGLPPVVVLVDWSRKCQNPSVWFAV